MVNLPSPHEQAARSMGERASFRGPRNHHNWGARLGRGREAKANIEPRTLGQLEELASRSVVLMEKFLPSCEHNFMRAMDLLRQQYNLHFIILCDRCKGTHDYDELIAPER